MADTAYDSPHPPPAANAICRKLCRIGKITPWIIEKGSAHRHPLQSKVICRSRTTALPFANDRAALREQPRCSSRTANKNDKQKQRNGC